jgi:3-hydroxybutyryl-CoA dehydratase
VGDEMPPFTASVAAKMMEEFGILIDDRNPVHFDDNFARNKGFPAAIAHSAVGSSLLLRMMTKWLGAWPLSGDEIEIAFVAPVLVGYELTARGLCTEVTEQVSLWDIWCENQDGKKLIAGTARIALSAAAA